MFPVATKNFAKQFLAETTMLKLCRSSEAPTRIQMTNITYIYLKLGVFLSFAAWATPSLIAQDNSNLPSLARSIVSDKCYKCHGPDENSREADLRLDQRKSALETLSPKDPSVSEFLRRIESNDPDEIMPPPESKIELSKDEIKTLRRWIESGAEYEKHWSFKPIPTSTTVPQIENDRWSKTSLDKFILEKLNQKKLTPQSMASKERLIRRATFDLTGLPPTLEEIDNFLDDNSDDAFEKVIDRLFQSPAYGERMTNDWLDIARYADSYGYQVDRDRYVWPYRDWVIRAFNQNMSYKQFVTEQLAGDLLPDATDDQILATTFNRLHSQKVEGGSVPEEFRVEYVADRLHTFSTAFLGLTVECARCHDHKFDPISQKEYYQLFSFFNNIEEAGLYSYFTSSVPTPTLRMSSDAQKQQLAKLKEAVKKVERDLAQTAGSLLLELKENPPSPPAKLEGVPHIPSGLVKRITFDEKIAGANQSVAGKFGKAIQLTGDDPFNVGVGNFRRWQPFSVSLWIQVPDVKERAVIFHRSRAWTDAASRGYQLLVEEGQLSFSLIHFWPGNALRVRTNRKIEPGKWTHVAVTYDGMSSAEGIEFYLDGKKLKRYRTDTLSDSQIAEKSTDPDLIRIVQNELYKNISGGGGDNIAIGQRFRDMGFKKGLVDEFQVYDRELSAVETAQLTGLGTDQFKMTDNFRDRANQPLLLHTIFQNPKIVAQLKSLKEARKKFYEAQDRITEIMVMKETQKPRKAYLLNRGLYSDRGEEVTAATPAIFPKISERDLNNRLGLANWLFDPNHPLAARVAANHYWQMIFGNGLVATPEDFGSQGAAATHPELLDFLARELINDKWDLQKFLKRLMLSSTYQQDSTMTAQARAIDSNNQFFSAATRYRMPAEMIRDNALALSGLLKTKIGGPPAKPYEVTVSFKPVGRDKGDNLYRRSLYTYWRRTGPAPVMMSLDAAKREICVVKRERTSTPLQALVLMNDPQFVEASRALAQNLMLKHGDKTEAMIQELFRLATSRLPSEKEKSILSAMYLEQLSEFQSNLAEAEKLLKTGDWPLEKKLAKPELAAMTLVVSAVLNLDSTVVKR